MNFDSGFSNLMDQIRLLLRVEKIFKRYCDEGHRPTRDEAKAWLESEGWRPEPLANLLREWGYPDE